MPLRAMDVRKLFRILWRTVAQTGRIESFLDRQTVPAEHEHPTGENNCGSKCD